MKHLTSLFALFILLAPVFIFAQEAQQTLVELPGNIQPGADGFTNYINFLYALSISVAALLAVIKIIIAGVKYMLTDIAPNKGAAISEIKGALLGLLLILAAVLILTVINPQLLKATLKFDPQPEPDYQDFRFSPIASSNSGGGASGGNTEIAPAQLKAAKQELAYIKKTFMPETDGDDDSHADFYNQSIPAEYIRLNGTAIVIEIGRFCVDSYNASRFSSLTTTQRAVAIADCRKDGGGSWAGRIAGRCSVAKGKPSDFSGESLTCRMPKQIIAANNLRINDSEAGGAREPLNWEEMVGACGSGGELYKVNGLSPQMLDGLLGGLTVSDYECRRF